MDDQQAKPSRKLIPRFSLRTLLLFTATLSFAGVLYAAWDSYGHLSTIPLPPCPPKGNEVKDTWHRTLANIYYRSCEDYMLIQIVDSYVISNPTETIIKEDRLCLYKITPPGLILIHDYSSRKTDDSSLFDHVISFSGDGSIETYNFNAVPAWIRGYTTSYPPDISNEGWLYSRTIDCGGRSTMRARLTESGHIEVQKPRRPPEEWGGVFWLYEFYAVLICAIGLAWSAYRDGRGAQTAP